MLFPSVGVVVCSSGYPDKVEDGYNLTWDEFGGEDVKELEKKNVSGKDRYTRQHQSRTLDNISRVRVGRGSDES